MANIPYIEKYDNKIFSALKMYSRVGAFPLDPTSVFNTKQDLLDYISEKGSYAYPGQVVAVANGDVNNASQDDDYSLYIIRSDRTVQEIGKNLSFESIDAALAFIDSNKGGIRPGELITIANETNGYSLHMVRDDFSLHRLSYEASDAPDVSWANLSGKPTSTPTDIDDAVSKKHEHANKDTLDKFKANTDGTLTFNETNVVAYKSDITWDNVDGKPDVYNKTESDNTFVKNTEVVTTPTANKILKLDDNAQIPAYILSGKIPMDNLPHGAVERCVVVADDEARFALTTDKVQTGDTVKVTDSGKMYFVVDDSKLTSEEGYEVYSAGSASTVAWEGVTGKPTTLQGYGITDAVNVADVVVEAEAGKILKVADDGKLHVSINGDAATVGGKQVSDFVAATEVVTEAQANKILKLDADGKLPTDITGEAGSVAWANVTGKPTKLQDSGITDAVNVADVVVEAEAGKILKVADAGTLHTSINGNAATATNVAWSGVTDKPTTLQGYGITDGYTQTHIDETFVAKSQVTSVAEAGKILLLNNDKKLPADITGNAATATNVAWSGVTDKPTTIAGYGITDAYTEEAANNTFVPKTDVATTAAPNMLLKLDAEGKLPANILSGIIPLANIPHGAIEKCHVVDNDTARFALTNLDVQNGDTVKVNNSGKMYFVVDDTKLNSEAGYEVYTAGSASSVAWSGVTGTPTTIAGYGITDAFTKDESNNTFVLKTNVVTTAEAGKILLLNNDKKLPADITGNAATATNVAWSGVTGTPTTIAGYGITDAFTKDESNNTFVPKTDVVTAPVANAILKLNADAKLPTSITGEAGSVAWANIVGKPNSTAAEIDEAVSKRHEHANKAQLDKINVDEAGKMTFDGDNTVAYMSDLTSIISIGSVDPAATMPVGGLWFDTSAV